MPIELAIADITLRLRQGKFPNEPSISQGIVLRLLHELEWNTWDAGQVWPEYQTGEGRADFALCNPAAKPAIFVEVKQPGKAEDAVRQALEYAFHVGVPFVVLTDGRTWSFYLPAEQGSYEDRRVYKLDLFEQSAEQASAALTRYLAKSRVENGEALETARREYRSRSRRSQACNAIAETWRELVQKGDEQLVELLSGAVEAKIGIRPEADDVAEFLAKLSGARLTPDVLPKTHTLTPPATPQAACAGDGTGKPSRDGALTLLGKRYAYSSAKDAMVIVLRELAKRDPSFLERCSQHPDAQGRKRRYIARTPEELYPDREDLREMRETLPGGWLVATNLNNILKKTIIRLAAETARLSHANDVVVGF